MKMYFRWLSGCCLDIVSHSTRGNPARPSMRSFRATMCHICHRGEHGKIWEWRNRKTEKMSPLQNSVFMQCHNNQRIKRCKTKMQGPWIQRLRAGRSNVKSKKVGPDFKSGNHMNLLKIGSPRPYERFGDNLDSLRKGRLLIWRNIGCNTNAIWFQLFLGENSDTYIYISHYHTKSTMVGPVFQSLVDLPGEADYFKMVRKREAIACCSNSLCQYIWLFLLQKEEVLGQKLGLGRRGKGFWSQNHLHTFLQRIHIIHAWE